MRTESIKNCEYTVTITFTPTVTIEQKLRNAINEHFKTNQQSKVIILNKVDFKKLVEEFKKNSYANTVINFDQKLKDMRLFYMGMKIRFSSQVDEGRVEIY